MKNFFRTFAQKFQMGLFTISVWLTEYHPQQTGIFPQTLQMAEHSPLARAGEKVDKLGFSPHIFENQAVDNVHNSVYNSFFKAFHCG